MMNNNAAGSRVLPGVFFATLLAVFGLAACGSGGGGSTTTNNTNTPSAGGIVLSLVPARTSGVAPLAVFFDASATTDIGVTDRPFHDLEYTWDFGDPSAGIWASGARPGVSSKNSATGPVAAHVFETPGTYTVTMTANDGTNTNTTTTTIMVTDPDTVFAGANTVCIAATTTPVAGSDGCPAGATVAMQPNFATAVNTYALTGKRVLFKRGDTFTESASAPGKLIQTGPGIIGAFGTGAKPKLLITNVTSSQPFIVIGKPTVTTGVSDWRIMDLEFDGQSQDLSLGVSQEGTFNRITFLRLHMHDIYTGIAIDGEGLEFINVAHPGHKMFDQIAIVDSTITPFASKFGWRIYAYGKYISILGNTLGNIFDTSSMASHTIRLPNIVKSVISNNLISRPGSAALAIKLHGPGWCDATSLPGECLNGAGTVALPTPTYSYLTNTAPIGVLGENGGYTQQIIISDNEIIGSASPYIIDAGPQNTFRDERVKDVIFERNWLKAGAGTQSAFVIMSRETTVRNNICDLTGSSNQRYCVNIKPYGATPSVSPAPFPDTIWAYNNSAYSGDASAGTQSFAAVRVELGATNVTARNNLAYAPFAGAGLYHLIDDAAACGAACITASNNSTDNQVKNTFPGWVSATPAIPADFRLTSGSYGLDTGAVVKVFSDFFRTSRPQNGVIDMGSVEGP